LNKAGLTLLLVEQNVQMALAISDYAYVIAEGCADLEGPARDLMKNEKVRGVLWFISLIETIRK
jgi:branched-chain amino acid transport system ATP-binding protein